jgi:hypothetical protein
MVGFAFSKEERDALIASARLDPTEMRELVVDATAEHAQ